eukprot:CAMPEP_0194027894 /NCGR_PEP_ID=MMETSP0009_2-20130614/1935_1 /TAXON_ID=210454 /ORGANISM="Grammatophora oceanica, Strain CCMP 410" /LENGTH=75 /DNA_ID=CAMNT_0038667089 /DNA_START=73 /DNA_END=296 /DNA_ORIENTATION=+
MPAFIEVMVVGTNAVIPPVTLKGAVDVGRTMIYRRNNYDVCTMSYLLASHHRRRPDIRQSSDDDDDDDDGPSCPV